MKKTTRTIFKTSLATSLAVVATGSAGVMAAGAPYTFVGSDTITEVVKDSINGCVHDGICTAGQLTYSNTGSGAAENALLATIPTQRIAPMSRNFKSGVLTAHSGWAPAQKNIIGLDAAVIVERTTGGTGYRRAANIAAALDPDQVNFPHHAAVDTLLGLLLGGKGGLGDTASCSAPERLAAYDQLLTMTPGTTQITHFYRRDDRSGTADTMKEKLRIQRFCNGRSPGVTGIADDNMATGNDDSDPIRRVCPNSDSTLNPTPCTLYPATTRCTHELQGDACTQGLVVSLSQSDPGQADITTSIAYRVSHDQSAQTLGFGGREASRRFGNSAASINTISPSDPGVRGDVYLLSRRLYVNFSDQVVGFGRTPARTADDIAQETAEEALYSWITDPDVGGRGLVDPILVAHGFLPCIGNGGVPSGSNNLCSKQIPPPAAETTPKQCIPPGVNGNGTDICCADPTVLSTSGTPCAAFPCAAANAACLGTGQGNCCNAGTTGCTDQGDGTSACN